MEHPRPDQPPDLVALAALRERALYHGPESTAQAALSFVTSVRRDPEQAAAKGLPQWRGLATRYEKTATVYRAGLLIAGIFLWSAR